MNLGSQASRRFLLEEKEHSGLCDLAERRNLPKIARPMVT